MLKQYRPSISAYLSTFFDEQRSVLKQHYWTNDVIDRYSKFATAGKLFRGSLLLATYEMLAHQPSQRLLPAAASVELMQSALLIHDDIIDRDSTRRGKPSFIKQYQQLAAESQYQSSEHMGLSLALAAGDMAFFWGYQLLNRLELAPDLKSDISHFFTHEYCQVGLAEMLDVHQTAAPKMVSEKDILQLYLYKTGRYTLCLPMVMAAKAAEVPVELEKAIDQLGEVLGLLFQIKDDELGLFGSEAETGKPVTSDVREGKKTLYYFYVFQLASAETQRRLRMLFGKKDLSLEELEEVRAAIKKSGAKKLVDSYIEKYEQQAKQLIKDMALAEDQKQVFSQFVDENVIRKH